MREFGSGRFLTSSSADTPWLESSFLPGRGLLAAGGGGRLCKVVFSMLQFIIGLIAGIVLTVFAISVWAVFEEEKDGVDK